ncbi:unnamed protein product [Prunus armeniaca]
MPYIICKNSITLLRRNHQHQPMPYLICKNSLSLLPTLLRNQPHWPHGKHWRLSWLHLKKKFEARVAASKKDREALEIELAKSKKETAFKDGQLEYMMDLYMKQSVGEKQYSTIGEETDSVSEEIDLLEFLGVSNDTEVGVLDGELADSLTDSDDEQNE